MTTMPNQEISQNTRQLMGGRFLTFRLDEDEFGIEITRVHEIIGMQTITQVPRMEAHVRGILNLRDRIIPIIDLRARFLMPTVEETSRTCIIVVEAYDSNGQSNRLGLVVDEVAEVLKIPQESIQHGIGFSHGLHSDCLAGLGVVDEEVKMLLDIDHVVTSEEVGNLARLAGQSKTH